MALETHKDFCVDCGKIYNATKYSYFCPKCRKKRKSQNAKRNNLARKGRKARLEKKDGTEKNVHNENS